jgi:hypothetical protein
MPYPNVEPHLQQIAEAAKEFIENRFNVKNPKIGKELDPDIHWQPTLHWKNKTGFIGCEVSGRPFRPIVEIAFGGITSKGLPVTIFIAYPSAPAIPLKDFNEDIEMAKRYGIGLISISDDLKGTIQHRGVSVPLFISPPDFSKFKNSVRPMIMSAYEDFIDGNPTGGVQKLGQLVESAMVHLGTQARKKGTFAKGGFSPSKYYPQANLIDEMMAERIIDNGILGRCRGFSDDRGSVSHSPKSLKAAIKVERLLKDCFVSGLRILEELPEAMTVKGYKFRV